MIQRNILNHTSQYSKNFLSLSKCFSTFQKPEPVFEKSDIQLDHEVECEINFALNYPDLPVAEGIKEGLIFAAENNLNQYTRYQGHPPLVENLSRLLSSKFECRNYEIDPMSEIIVGTGATGVISGIIYPFFNTGDEAIIFSNIEPRIEQQLLQRGLKLIKSELNEDQSINFEDLNQKVNSSTRLLYFDNPSLMNGKQNTIQQLDRLAQLIRKQEDLYVICNESLFSNLENMDSHVTFANLPGMWERTFSVYSSTSMFGTPGLRVGWLITDKNILKDLSTYQAYSYFATSTTAMHAIAYYMDSLKSTEDLQHPLLKGVNQQNKDFLHKNNLKIEEEIDILSHIYFQNQNLNRNNFLKKNNIWIGANQNETSFRLRVTQNTSDLTIFSDL